MSENVAATQQTIKPQKFAAEKREIWAAAAMYAAAYIYVYAIFRASDIFFTLFTALFIGITELLCHKRQRSRESWFWLGGLIVVVLSNQFGLNQVWEQELGRLFAHGFAVKGGHIISGGQKSHSIVFHIL